MTFTSYCCWDPAGRPIASSNPESRAKSMCGFRKSQRRREAPSSITLSVKLKKRLNSGPYSRIKFWYLFNFWTGEPINIFHTQILLCIEQKNDSYQPDRSLQPCWRLLCSKHTCMEPIKEVTIRANVPSLVCAFWSQPWTGLYPPRRRLTEWDQIWETLLTFPGHSIGLEI